MTVGILGLGLIGGSLARAYALEGHRVLCAETDEAILSFAILAGAAEAPLTPENISECDLILMAIYPEGCIQWLTQNGKYIHNNALVIDCCGIKENVCKHCFPLAQEYGFTFVGGHPMAGTQFSGFKYSRADMFEGAPMVFVPDRFDDPELLSRAKKALEPCHFGSFSVTTAAEHDKMIAFTSQMPHIVSNAFIKSPTALRHNGFSAGSYRDLTRVAWLNATMWAELFLENQDNIMYELDILLTNLQKYKDAVSRNDRTALIALLEEGKQRKEEVDG